MRFILLLLGLVLPLVATGERWCEYVGKYLAGYSSQRYMYDSLDEAQRECLKRTDCGGVTKEPKPNTYTLRRGSHLGNWAPETSWKWTDCDRDHQCPQSHPYAYTGGNYCCKYGQEKHYGPLGSRCDGGPIGLTSDCCKDDAHTKCATPPCAAPGDCNNYCGEITKDGHEFVKMDYHLDRAEEVPQGALKPIAKKRMDNRMGTITRSISFTLSETTSDTVSYSHTTGASISSSATFSAGVPFVAEGGISVEVSASYEYSSGKEYTKESTMEANFVCSSPPGILTICKAYLTRVKIKVPYTQTWAVKRYPQCTCTTDGVFTGNEATELRMTVNEVDRIVARSATKKRSVDGYVVTEKLQ